MKKFILTTLLLFLLIKMIHAQSGICLAGFQEIFTTKEFPDPIHPTKFTDQNTNESLVWSYYNRDPSFYIPTFNTINNSLDVLLNIKAKRYEPINISFGNEPGTAIPKTFNFSKNFDYELIIKNTGTTPIFVRFGANDIHGNQISLNLQPSPSKAAEATIQMLIQPGETETLGKGSSNGTNEENIGTFLGCSGVTWTNGIATILTDFDYTKVTGFNITVIDGLNNPPKNLKGSMQIMKVRVGDISCFKVTSLSNNSKTTLPIIYPNPVTNRILHFANTVTYAHIYNNNGKIVLSVFNANHVYLDALPAGLYYLNTLEGSSEFIINE